MVGARCRTRCHRHHRATAHDTRYISNCLYRAIASFVLSARGAVVPVAAAREQGLTRPVLCCAVLCCAVLCCAVLCCAVLCCAVLCCAVLCCACLGSMPRNAPKLLVHRASPSSGCSSRGTSAPSRAMAWTRGRPRWQCWSPSASRVCRRPLAPSRGFRESSVCALSVVCVSRMSVSLCLYPSMIRCRIQRVHKSSRRNTEACDSISKVR
jgi:hypothetical protein